MGADRWKPLVEPVPNTLKNHVSVFFFDFRLVKRPMPSFLPLGRRIEPWPAGPPGSLNRPLLASLADEVFLAEKSPLAQRILPNVITGETIKKHVNKVSTQLTNLYFCRLRDARVVSPPVAVINRHKDIFGDISVDWRHPRTNHKYRGWKFVRSPLHLIGNSLCLAATGAETFFHLLFDSLGRLWISEKAGLRPQDFDYLIVQQDTPLLRRFLALLGLNSPRLVDLSKVRHVRCENLFVGSYQSAMGHYHPDFLSWLRTRIGNYSTLGAASAGKTLFLSRYKAGSRRLINEELIENTFPNGAILRISLESFTLDEQLKLFFNARSVLAPHGGGLSHLAWAKPNLPVLELFPTGYFNACYWDLSSAVGARYGALEGVSTGTGVPSNCDFTISPNILFDAFDAITKGFVI
jgi:hypothetical protein